MQNAAMRLLFGLVLGVASTTGCTHEEDHGGGGGGAAPVVFQEAVCMRCAMAIERPIGGERVAVCPGESFALYDDIVLCVCAGACSHACDCESLPTSIDEACRECLENDPGHCGEALEECSADR